MPGDGSCFFYAISRCLTGVDYFYDLLRESVKHEIDENQEWYIHARRREMHYTRPDAVKNDEYNFHPDSEFVFMFMHLLSDAQGEGEIVYTTSEGINKTRTL